MAARGAGFDLHQQRLHLRSAGLHVHQPQPMPQHIGLSGLTQGLQSFDVGWVAHGLHVAECELLQQGLRLRSMRCTARKGLSEGWKGLF